MSHFYADIQGNRGEATRGGTKGSGIGGHIRGWGVGARVSVDYDEDSGKDIVKVHRTSGSNGGGTKELLAEYCNDQNTHAEVCNYCQNRFKCFTERYSK